MISHDIQSFPFERLSPFITDHLTSTTSRWQGQTREGMSEGSRSAKMRADEQKSHIRPSSRGESAHDDETRWFAGQGKCGGCASKVHVLIWGDLTNVRWSAIAPLVATPAVICQKSADGIVAGSHRP